MPFEWRSSAAMRQDSPEEGKPMVRMNSTKRPPGKSPPDPKKKRDPRKQPDPNPPAPHPPGPTDPPVPDPAPPPPPPRKSDVSDSRRTRSLGDGHG